MFRYSYHFLRRLPRLTVMDGTNLRSFLRRVGRQAWQGVAERRSLLPLPPGVTHLVLSSAGRAGARLRRSATLLSTSPERHRPRTPFHTLVPSLTALLLVATALPTSAGPFSPGKGGLAETGIADAGVPGFAGPDGEGSTGTGNYINPVFFDWADSVATYIPSDVLGPYAFDGIGRPPNYPFDYGDPTQALGPVTGSVVDIVSLGDMDATEIEAHGNDPASNPTGSITVRLAEPIQNLSGADFATFENAMVAQYSAGGGINAGLMGAELGYVEVSTDGTHFVRFPSEFLNPAPGGSQAYLSQDVSNIYNLAGKHANGYVASWGTPFDLSDLSEAPLVLSGTVDLNDIRYIRIVDIPGDGSFTDHIGNPIYDQWVTWGSGGFDLEAVGVISRPIEFHQWPQLENIPDPEQRDPDDDPDEDGWSNLEECALAMIPWIKDPAPLALEFETADGNLTGYFSFVRDERLRGVTYEVWASSNMKSWDCIATSTDGAPMEAMPGFTPDISESSLPSLNSVGVLRCVRIRNSDTSESPSKQFYQLRITQS